MQTLQINTTQNVSIDFKLASEMQRIFAFVIDNVLKIAYFYFIYVKLIEPMISGSYLDDWSFMSLSFLGLSPVILYSLYTEILMKGQTIGKKLLNIRVITLDGYVPSKLDLTIRWFLRIVDFNLFFLLVVYATAMDISNETLLGMLFLVGKLVGIICVATSKKNQRVGDLIANTIVVDLKDNARFSKTIEEELEENYVPKYPNVIKLTDNDMRIIKDTFTVAKAKRDYKKLIKLRTKIAEVTQIKPEENSDIEFIDRVIKDYNYYTKDL